MPSRLGELLFDDPAPARSYRLPARSSQLAARRGELDPEMQIPREREIRPNTPHPYVRARLNGVNRASKRGEMARLNGVNRSIFRPPPGGVPGVPLVRVGAPARIDNLFCCECACPGGLIYLR